MLSSHRGFLAFHEPGGESASLQFANAQVTALTAQMEARRKAAVH